MADDEKIELVRGSGNIYEDFGLPDANIRQIKATLGSRIIGILDDRGLSTRKAQSLTGVDNASFSRIRNAQFKRFTIDRLMAILQKLEPGININMEFKSESTKHRSQQRELVL